MPCSRRRRLLLPPLWRPRKPCWPSRRYGRRKRRHALRSSATVWCGSRLRPRWRERGTPSRLRRPGSCRSRGISGTPNRSRRMGRPPRRASPLNRAKLQDAEAGSPEADRHCRGGNRGCPGRGARGRGGGQHRDGARGRADGQPARRLARPWLRRSHAPGGLPGRWRSFTVSVTVRQRSRWMPPAWDEAAASTATVAADATEARSAQDAAERARVAAAETGQPGPAARCGRLGCPRQDLGRDGVRWRRYCP